MEPQANEPESEQQESRRSSANSDGALSGALVVYPLWTFLFVGLIVVISLVGQVFAAYAAIQAFQGKPFSYPFLGRL